LIKFDPFWTDLIQKNQKQSSHFYPFCKCDNFYCNIFRLVRNPIWSNLIHFGQIWSKKKIKNITGIFILSVNVTTYYCNIFRLVRNPIWSSLIKFDPFWTDLIQKNQKIKRPFFFFLKMWQLCILTFFVMCNH